MNQPGSAEDKQDLPALLRHAVTQANETLGAHAAAAAETRTGMGGTVVATIFSGGRLHWISVGDSVLYLFRDMTLTRLNADHSMAPQIDLMVKRGMLGPEEALRHPQRNMLTSALMGEEIAEIDCPDASFELREGDVIILASDGLQFLPDPIIEALLIRARNHDCRRIARDLLEAVDKLDDPEQDNVSLIVACVTPCEKPEGVARGWLSRTGLLAPWRRDVSPAAAKFAPRD
jgi:serine/threonine protein phosphatase PrpC